MTDATPANAAEFQTGDGFAPERKGLLFVKFVVLVVLVAPVYIPPFFIEQAADRKARPAAVAKEIGAVWGGNPSQPALRVRPRRRCGRKRTGVRR